MDGKVLNIAQTSMRDLPLPMELPRLSLGQELDTIAILLTLLPREKLQTQMVTRDSSIAQISMRDSLLPTEPPRLFHIHRLDTTAMLITLLFNLRK